MNPTHSNDHSGYGFIIIGENVSKWFWAISPLNCCSQSSPPQLSVSVLIKTVCPLGTSSRPSPFNRFCISCSSKHVKMRMCNFVHTCLCLLCFQIDLADLRLGQILTGTVTVGSLISLAHLSTGLCIDWLQQ
eukprot:GHVT01002125.1.p1 GENE.GHVT01002125.1~~GHVT01002125.1.p1  ORF type:complete len:132 (-),score=3.47 GHVT01002125.1:16-411(-)